VLADFSLAALDVLGMTRAEFAELHGEALMWKRLREARDFYAGLGWKLGGKTLWKELHESTTWSGPKPMLLAAIPMWGCAGMRAWVAEHLGGGVATLCCGPTEKASFCCAGDILIDADEAPRLDWETAGGRFILHTTATASLAALAEIIAEPAAAE
jgi:hypothetical protein